MSEKDTQANKKLILLGYDKELAAIGVKESQRKKLLYGVNYLLCWLEAQGIPLAQMDEQAAWSYQGYCLEKPHHRTEEKRKLSTVITQIYMVKSFGEYLVKINFWSTNVFRALDPLRVVKNPLHGLLKEEDMGHFLDALENWENEIDLRNRMWAYRVHVMAEVQYSTGLRMSELGNLKTEDISLDRFEISVKEGKGGKDRIAYLTIYAADILREYLSIRHLVVKGGEKRNSFVFGPKPESLCRAYNIRLNKISASLNLGRFYNHKFRHQLGYHLLRAGCPIRSIQGILGHEKLSTTEIYTKVDVQDVKGVLDHYHPRSLCA